MKKFILKVRSLAVATVFMALIFNAMANDTIRFTWEAGANTRAKSFQFTATAGKTYTINWGNGVIETKTGEYTQYVYYYYPATGTYDVVITASTSDCLFTLLLCSNNNLTSLDVSASPQLRTLSCGNNQLTMLDVSANTALWEFSCNDNLLSTLNLNSGIPGFFCDNNQLTSLNLNKITDLHVISCDNNWLSLSELFIASERISKPINKKLGTQNLPAKTVMVDYKLFSDQAVFKGRYTNYVVTQNGSPASPDDYTVTDGCITFNTAGNYMVTMTNDAIVSHSDYPAKVMINIIVKEFSLDATLSNLIVSEGILTPAFSNTHYDYTVNLENAVQSIEITAIPTDPNATVNGDGYKSLQKGINKFIITVTDKNGEISLDYNVCIINGKVNITEILSKSNIKIYPNPTSYKLQVTSYELQVNEIEIYDIYGRKAPLNPPGGGEGGSIIIDISHLANGIYYLKAGNRIEKIIKNQ